MVSRKVDMKENVAESPEGGFSGTSGRQKLIQVCISARENCPESLKMLIGLAKKLYCHLDLNSSHLITPFIVKSMSSHVKGEGFNSIVMHLTASGL